MPLTLSQLVDFILLLLLLLLSFHGNDLNGLHWNVGHSSSSSRVFFSHIFSPSKATKAILKHIQHVYSRCLLFMKFVKKYYANQPVYLWIHLVHWRFGCQQWLSANFSSCLASNLFNNNNRKSERKCSQICVNWVRTDECFKFNSNMTHFKTSERNEEWKLMKKRWMSWTACEFHVSIQHECIQPPLCLPVVMMIFFTFAVRSRSNCWLWLFQATIRKKGTLLWNMNNNHQQNLLRIQWNSNPLKSKARLHCVTHFNLVHVGSMHDFSAHFCRFQEKCIKNCMNQSWKNLNVLYENYAYLW